MAFKTIHDFPESTNPSGDWFVLVDDGTGCYKKVKLSNLPGGGGSTTSTTTTAGGSTTSTTTTAAGSTTTSTSTTACSASDPDAIEFIEDAGITSCTEKVAINNLVIALKEFGIWNKMYAIYPFVGGSASSTAFNLKNPAQYNLSYTGGLTYASTGVKPNGTTGFANTGLNPFTDVTNPNSISIGVYSRENPDVNTFRVQIGAYESGGTNPETSIFFWDNGGVDTQTTYLGDQQIITVAPKNSFSGFHVATRTSDSLFKYFRNNVSQGTNTTTVTGALPNRDIYVFATNSSIAGGADLFSDLELAFAFIGNGLSDSEVANYTTAVAAFQTALGRNVV